MVLKTSTAVVLTLGRTVFAGDLELGLPLENGIAMVKSATLARRNSMFVKQRAKHPLGLYVVSIVMVYR